MGFLIWINENGALVSCIVSLLGVLVTVVYVVFTHKQMKATQKSVEIMKTELRMAKQPCLILEIHSIESREALPNGRRFMPVPFSIENIGDSPALSVFCVSYMVLQHTTTKSGNRVVNMYSGPFFIEAVKAGEKTVKNSIHYENREITYMFDDLSVNLAKNWKRVHDNPSQHAHRGTSLVLCCYYRNVYGQWFESKLTREIGFAVDQITKEKTKENLNEFTFPPRLIEDNTCFTLQLHSPQASPQYRCEPVDEKYVQSVLGQYKEDWPELFYED